MMKRGLVIGMVVIVLMGLLGAGFLWANRAKAAGCIGEHPDNLLGCLLAGPVAISVQVTGQVDQVSFYRADGSNDPVATIATNGRDMTQTISLPTSARYYFVVKKGDQVYQSRSVGFSTNQTRADLLIRGLNQWEGW